MKAPTTPTSLTWLGLIIAIVSIILTLWAIAKALPVLAEAILVHARVILLALEASQPTSYL